MKRRPSKAELRAELNRAMDEFLARGGEVREVPRGATGWENPLAAKPDFAFVGPRESRTPVNDVVASIESRKGKSTTPTAKPKRRAPRKKPVYDDFGEVIRWIWVNE